MNRDERNAPDALCEVFVARELSGEVGDVLVVGKRAVDVVEEAVDFASKIDFSVSHTSDDVR